MRWIDLAAKYIGTREVKGGAHNPMIVSWLVKLGAWWKDDETPWCGVFVASMLKQCGIAIPAAYYRARSWETWGKALSMPVRGCVVVFSRQGGGHVGFVVGQDKQGNLLVLGGNQGDEVNIRAFQRSRVTAYRWPEGEKLGDLVLPVMTGAELSRSEA